jgi:hypothetical protein
LFYLAGDYILWESKLFLGDNRLSCGCTDGEDCGGAEIVFDGISKRSISLVNSYFGDDCFWAWGVISLYYYWGFCTIWFGGSLLSSLGS